MQSSASTINLQYLVFSCRPSSSCLRPLPRFRVTSSVYLSINNVFKKRIPVQGMTNTVSLPSFMVLMTFLSYLTPFNTSSFLTCSLQLICASCANTTFQNVPVISDLLSKVSSFQQYTKLCSKCSSLLLPSLNLSPICWWEEIITLSVTK
jgi:hypothetical protein